MVELPKLCRKESLRTEDSDITKKREDTGLIDFLKVLPPVEFCCIYGSTLHPNNHYKSKMVDLILGVSDPQKWHEKNIQLNKDHYASWMVYLGGGKLVTEVADEIGVGVHFNPYVTWNEKTLKYGVVRMHDLIQDILYWKTFYLSGRLQKPVNILVDTLDVRQLNSVNLRSAVSAALLLLPPEFTEVDLYAKICSLSYMGDLRMLFAEDRDKVNKIVGGQFQLFQSMYQPCLEEYKAKRLLQFSGHQSNISQDCGLSATELLISSLARAVGTELGEKRSVSGGGVTDQSSIRWRKEAADCIEGVLRRKVMVSSARQAVSGLLAVGGVKAAKYLAAKMCKAWRSWT
ncbi:phosphatidate cytidylyltransferase, mitochondrial isoform X1 [Momordica charantia]|uniref:Phosphatidate cytidylyltransferase, mitochondrial n=1 Tax=Momordica charantia TaxID=3673 RepID=A0A6J1CXL3_MOMCH|nr:phosphatidate cytidylyltransferase, mitochondrial isoform X1 [Momordica charantia]